MLLNVYNFSVSAMGYKTIWTCILLLLLLENNLSMGKLFDNTTVAISGKVTTKCIAELGCFSNGSPFYHPMYRPVGMTPENNIRTKFTVFKREGTGSGKPLTLTIKSLRKSLFDPDLEIKIIIHGHVTEYNTLMLLNMLKDKLLEHGNYNVIVVNWKEFIGEKIFQTIANARVVGAQLTEYLTFLQDKAQITLHNVHLIGHGLGAHIAGWAGERLDNVGRITGLDPLGPWFQNAEDLVRLDSTDAAFVDVIHTNGGTNNQNGIGIFQPIGHIDFYPNGGQIQPGCPEMILAVKYGLVLGDDSCRSSICSHLKSIEFFISSMKENLCATQASPCDSWKAFKTKQCDGHYRKFRKAELQTMGFHSEMCPYSTISQKYFLDFNPYHC